MKSTRSLLRPPRPLLVVVVGLVLVASLSLSGPIRAHADTAVNLGVSDFGRILVDPATAHIFISSPGSSSIVVTDLNGTIVKTITGEAGASAMAIVAGTLYVLSTAGAIDRIDTSTLTETGLLVSGLGSPRDLTYAGSKLWTSKGICGSWSVDLVSIDPAATDPTATVYPGTFTGPSNNYLSYCGAGFATNPVSNPGFFLAFDAGGISPPELTSFDVSSGSPVQTNTALESILGNLGDVAMSPDQSHFVTASGAPYEFDEWTLSTLAQDGVIYTANPYPTSVATTAAAGGRIAGGLAGYNSDPDLFIYKVGSPAAPLITFGHGNPVPPRGVAWSPDGAKAYVIFGESGNGTFLEVVPVPTAPGPPAGVIATAGIDSATVSWNAPSSSGSSPITSYTVTSEPGGARITTTTPSATFTSLSAAASYTFTVVATNASGSGPVSAPSIAVTPIAAGEPSDTGGSFFVSAEAPCSNGTQIFQITGAEDEHGQGVAGGDYTLGNTFLPPSCGTNPFPVNLAFDCVEVYGQEVFASGTYTQPRTSASGPVLLHVVGVSTPQIGIEFPLAIKSGGEYCGARQVVMTAATGVISILPEDVGLHLGLSSSTVTTGGQVVASVKLENLASTSRTVSLTATVVDANLTTYPLAQLTIVLAPSQTVHGTRTFTVASATPRGKYAVFVVARDQTTLVTAETVFTVI